MHRYHIYQSNYKYKYLHLSTCQYQRNFNIIFNAITLPPEFAAKLLSFAAISKLWTRRRVRFLDILSNFFFF